jgi:deoxyxylulose-5-phosphate synthase
MLGIPDNFIEHATQAALRKSLGLDAEGIARKALALIDKTHQPSDYANFKRS